MSRVADAFRKSLGTTFAPSSPLDPGERSGESDSWITTDAPWDLSEPPRQPLDSSIAGVTRPSEIAAVRRRYLADPTSASREELTLLVQRIFQSRSAERRIRSVLFSAIGPADGSANLCAAAADALASQTNGSVCLVDANLRTPSLHAPFGLDNSPGFSDVLIGAGDHSARLKRLASNLWLLPGGTSGNEALPCLGADQIRSRVTELLAAFDYILVDSPAASIHNDATVLGPLVDGVVLLIEANSTRREVARKTVEHLLAANVTILGTVLTNRTFPIPEAIYRRL